MKILLESIDKTDEFAGSPAYKDFRELVSYADQMCDSAKPASPREYPDKFFSDVELYIRYGAFRKLGKGSSRTAYSFDADPRYVLKFAHNGNGLKQNQTELKNANAGDYACTVRILDYDENGVFIVEDRCAESTYADWNRIIGISPNMLSKIVRVVFEKRETVKGYSLTDLRDEIRDDYDTAYGILKKTSAMDDELTERDYPKVVSCVENLVKASHGESDNPKWIALYDLFRFYFDHGLAAMIPEELLFIDQWGVRPGRTPDEDSLIIIDPGVDEDFMPFVGKDGERVR